MPEFIPDHTPPTLDDFTAAYLDCAEWLIPEEDKDRDCNGWSPDAVAQATTDCADFQHTFADLLAQYDDECGRGMSGAGHDFWLTRNRHGAGFWDRGSHPCLRELTDAARSYGECDVYLGDDAFLHLS